MSSTVVYATCVLLLVIMVNSLFTGDGCLAESEAGSCTPLSQCQPLLAEIKQAGTPMPRAMRKKLQRLSCGFDADEPLVCCVSSSPNEEQTTSIPNWDSSNHIGGVSSGNTNLRPTPNPSRGNGNTWDNTGNPNSNYPMTLPSSSDSPPDVRNHRNIKLLPQNCGILESDRIWGGNRTHLYEMPWMVLIAYDSTRGTKLSCGGTLVTEHYVLTAAHCVAFLGNLELTGIVLGEYDVRKDPDCERAEGELLCAPSVRNVSISRAIAHPGYSPHNLYDDIALVRLAEPADFTKDNMKAICLPTTPELQKESLVGKKGIVAGWGATEDGLQSPVLLSVDLPVVSNTDCTNAYSGKPQIHSSQLCAGGVEDKDSCGGDSGGPLMYPGQILGGAVRYVQRGVVSFGSKRCGLGGFPGVYTRVSHYMDWILDNIDN